MSFTALLKDLCTIENYVRDRTLKTATETWNAQKVETRCRVLKREASTYNPEQGTSTTKLRVRIVLPKSAIIGTRDRIVHDGRRYEVLEINLAGGYGTHHIVAICNGKGAPV